MKRVLIGVLIFLVSMVLSAATKIAVFDYDDRSGEIRPQSKIIEEEIIKAIPGVEVEQFNSSGNEAKAVEMIRAIDTKGFDLAVVITTDATKIALHFMKETPFLFTNCNNPEFMGIDMKEREREFSGVTYYVPLREQLDFFRKFKDIKSIGFIFDDNASSRTNELRESRLYCSSNKLGFSAELIKSSSEIEEATTKLLQKNVDAIILTTSGTVYNEARKVTKLAYAKGVPVFSYHKKGVEYGAVASLSSDYTRMNTELLPEMIKKIILEKKSAKKLPIAYLAKPDIAINRKSIAQLNYVVDKEIMSKAQIFE